MARREEITHSFEAKILWQSEKSRLVEMTIPEDGHYKFFVPKKCTLDLNESDGDGNWIFIVNDWWWNKRHDFEADE